MQKAYSGWELKACSGCHDSFPAVPTCFAGEGLHDGVVTHGFCLSGRRSRFMFFPGEAPGCWSLWPEEGMDYARAQPPAPGGWSRCSGTGCGAARGSPGECPGSLRSPVPWTAAVGAVGGRKRGLPPDVRSTVLWVLRFVCGGRALVSIHDYLNVSTLRILSVF